MTAQSIPSPAKAAADAAAEAVSAGVAHGAELVVPLNRLKASPKNARRTPHPAASIEALAASIKAKGVLQPPVVETERKDDGEPTGNWLVTIGEGRRQALRLLAKRKAVKRTHPVRVIVDADNDPHEISLDENITREAMHPADQFEAFKRLADEKGYGPEEIAARFGVSAHVVRQRLRLGAAAPELMAAYREERIALDQLIAFCVSEDQDRQRQVLAQVGPHTPAYAIRRAMTEEKVRTGDRRALFVGVEAYEAAGGSVLRDLFTEDGGGWLEDPALLDRLVAEKLAELAEDARRREGWKWAEAGTDYHAVHDLARVYPVEVERSEEDAAKIAALSEEYDRLVSETDGAETLPPDADARLEKIDRALQAFGPDFDYAPEAKARTGVMVFVGHDGMARFERGLVRAEDAPAPDVPEAPDVAGEGDDGDARDGGSGETPNGEGEPDERAGLSDRLLTELTAHRTMGLRDAIQAKPATALAVLVHAMALEVFYPGYGLWTPLQLRLGVTPLDRLAPGAADGPAGRRVADRCEAWGARLPERPEALWAVVAPMRRAELLDLLACCVGVGLHAVRDPHDRRPGALEQAEVLATEVGLDMSRTWTATAAAYFSRVPKAKVLEAVAEAAGAGEAARIAPLKKTDMAEAAERLAEGTGWLPPVLRTAPPQGDDEDNEDGEDREAGEGADAGAAPEPEAVSGDEPDPRVTADGYSFAAE